jgi:hypothetical protein
MNIDLLNTKMILKKYSDLLNSNFTDSSILSSLEFFNANNDEIYDSIVQTFGTDAMDNYNFNDYIFSVFKFDNFYQDESGKYHYINPYIYRFKTSDHDSVYGRLSSIEYIGTICKDFDLFVFNYFQYFTNEAKPVLYIGYNYRKG